MIVDTKHIASFQRSNAALEKILADYLDHGVMLRVNDYRGDWRSEIWPRFRAERREIGFVTNTLVPPTMCRAAATELGWRFIIASKALQNGANLSNIVNLFVPTLAADTVAGLVLVSQATPRDLRGWSGIGIDRRKTLLHFRFVGDLAVQLFDDWYAQCYRNPDHIRHITKRGYPIHTYPGGNNGPQAPCERSLAHDHHTVQPG